MTEMSPCAYPFEAYRNARVFLGWIELIGVHIVFLECIQIVPMKKQRIHLVDAEVANSELFLASRSLLLFRAFR